MKKIIITFSLVAALSFILINPVFALIEEGCPAGSTNCLSNPLSVSTPQALIGKIITSILGIVGSLALLMFVYGGLIWMTSSGNQEKVKQGRDTLMWAAIGLFVIFSAYALTRFVLSSVA